MNEYIKDGENGILYNLDDIKPDLPLMMYAEFRKTHITILQMVIMNGRAESKKYSNGLKRKTRSRL